MRRLLVAFGLACVLAVGVVATAPAWSPLCVLYDSGDPMYWMLGCWIDPPPPNPQA